MSQNAARDDVISHYDAQADARRNTLARDNAISHKSACSNAINHKTHPQFVPEWSAVPGSHPQLVDSCTRVTSTT